MSDFKNYERAYTEAINQLYDSIAESASASQSSAIGKNIRFYRKKAQLMQSDLADALDISKTIISRYERGEAVPPLDRIKAISEALNCRISDLLDIETTSQAKEKAIMTMVTEEAAILGKILTDADYSVYTTSSDLDEYGNPFCFHVTVDNEPFFVDPDSVERLYERVLEYTSFIFSKCVKEFRKEMEAIEDSIDGEED